MTSSAVLTGMIYMKLQTHALQQACLEEKIIGIIESEAPMKVLQVRANYSRWLDHGTKEIMKMQGCSLAQS